MLPDNLNPVPAQSTAASEQPKEQPTRVITVRLTPTEWRNAKEAAHLQRTSLNLFCVGAINCLAGETIAAGDAAKQVDVTAGAA